ncbi:MAG: hypothetical protein Q8M95_09195 [Candidatus Methanoperedens sp.]|nr:hypothetical protein [Candidatus Methanoperedens sp.]
MVYRTRNRRSTRRTQIYCFKNEWLVMMNLNTDIGTYGVKPADGGGEEYEGAGERADGEGDGK